MRAPIAPVPAPQSSTETDALEVCEVNHLSMRNRGGPTKRAAFSFLSPGGSVIGVYTHFELRSFNKT